MDNGLKIAAACWELLEDHARAAAAFFYNMRTTVEDELKARTRIRRQQARQSRFEESVMRDIESL